MIIYQIQKLPRREERGALVRWRRTVHVWND